MTDKKTPSKTQAPANDETVRQAVRDLYELVKYLHENPEWHIDHAIQNEHFQNTALAKLLRK